MIVVEKTTLLMRTKIEFVVKQWIDLQWAL